MFRKALIALSFVALCATPNYVSAQCTTVAESVTLGGLSTLAALAKGVGLLDMLSDNTTTTAYTVFAPDDKAFEASTIGSLGLEGEPALTPAQIDTIKQILSLHVVMGSFPAATLKAGDADLQSLAGTALESDGKLVTVGDATATISYPDAGTLLCADSVVHFIDTVLVPTAEPSPSPAPTPTTPTDPTTPTPTTPSPTDPTTPTPTAPTPSPTDPTTPSASPPAVTCSTLVEAAAALERDYPLKTLLALIDAVGLTDTLNDTASTTAYTVFAPTDDAFASSDYASLVAVDLTDEQKAEVARVLSLHVVEGTYDKAALKKGDATLQTLLSEAMLTSDGKTVTYNETTAAFTYADASTLACGGSVMHVIDKVLVPGPAPPAPPPDAAATDSPKPPTASPPTAPPPPHRRPGRQAHPRASWPTPPCSWQHCWRQCLFHCKQCRSVVTRRYLYLSCV